MLHEEFDAPETLRDVIKCFWYNHRAVEGQTSFKVLPDGYAEIIFYFGTISMSEDLNPLPSPFMMGLLNEPVIFYTKDRLEIIGIRCHPWTVFDLLGLPSEKNSVHIFQHPIARLQSTLSVLMQAGKIPEALGEVQQYFLDARAHINIDSVLSKAGVAMKKANGSMPVSEVAAAAHATVRTLERNFKQSSGHTVKDVSAVMRFEQVRNRLWLEPESSLAGVAHELGYTDQSHLSKEFKRYSGTTPAAFARKAKKEKLALSKDFVAFIQA
jgi:AraC-like DNA-binding protein